MTFWRCGRRVQLPLPPYTGEQDSSLVLVNDPDADADRLGAAVRERDDRYVALNGKRDRHPARALHFVAYEGEETPRPSGVAAEHFKHETPRRGVVRHY
ncbi:MAG: hypothetical protein BMS9Abin37_0700 [Acidobacteriota bacterium]|nr:MAG: hypothetical protein BMS9Abin37_0700 [Acidobacteriota bacterium]